MDAAGCMHTTVHSFHRLLVVFLKRRGGWRVLGGMLCHRGRVLRVALAAGVCWFGSIGAVRGHRFLRFLGKNR